VRKGERSDYVRPVISFNAKKERFYIRWSCMLCTLHQILSRWQSQEKWDRRACSKYGEDVRCVQDFGGETWWKEFTWKTWA